MKRRSRIRIRMLLGLIAVVVMTVAAVAVWRRQTGALQPTAWTTGGVLMGVVVFLASFHWRKQLSWLPQLGTATLWMQIHIYVGFLSIVLFALHVGPRSSLGFSGPLEQMLAALYLIVASSGLMGLYLTRTIPKKLANLNREIIYERIPRHRRQVSDQSRQLSMSSELASTTLAEFYVSRLVTFFDRPRSWWYRLWPNSRWQRRLVKDIRDLQRYCSSDEQQVAWKLADLVREKEDLDYHYAQQWKLKAWLFFHVGLTYSLLIVGTVHGMIAMAFRGA